jgi:hypothetical protein
MKPLRDILEKFLKKEKLGAHEDPEKRENDLIFQNWEEIAGKEIAQNTQPYKITGNNLFIYVKNSVIMSEMVYYKKYIITKINNFSNNKIKNITFKVKK